MLFNETVFQLVFYHDVRTVEEYFTKTNVRYFIGQYRYSILSDLENEKYYKTNDKYEFLLHYPELNESSYNWWRQSLSPTIQNENSSKQGTDDHYVLGYENISVQRTSNNWGGLSLTANKYGSYINGDINTIGWHYAIGCYGHESGIPGPFGGKPNYLKFVALYDKINNLNMIKCITIKFNRNSFLNSNLLLYVIIIV
ncbi:hypothetical protein TVAG_209080 [Trichomonas vaginalis G3]|uniref:Uncharacterized protein n=1 Tax=Trichomonas vaginalis (strain ATCC PRA-98 / G3) TaxID=412133 RepID=A2DVF0_TRIV3|nr:glycine-rich protein family [Trichomonas vaginalis G3]EAY15629.1 hypothetical protein TVAG_209080 [Trichomonas vaginalis G3]KAI5530235.1 glycine-rich protein family [Trichomonas vaginalis G3]|eukprot:XP_001327852.1 hypothetical protein [Trichomonas vaginalis G3]